MIALPHGDLASYEAALTPTSAPFQQPTASSYVNLSLPKVAFTSPSFSLIQPLGDLGMVQAFEPTAADFSGMVPDAGIYISDVVQKATVTMAETYVQASAATAVVGSSSGAIAPPPPITINVNRPFLVSIVDGPTGRCSSSGTSSTRRTPGRRRASVQRADRLTRRG